MSLDTIELSRNTQIVIRSLFRTLDDETSALIQGAAIEEGIPLEEYVSRLLIDKAREYRDTLGDVPPQAYDLFVRMAATKTKRGRPPRQPEELARLQELYLSALKDTCSLQVARAVAGVNSHAPYNWARADPAFKERWNTLREWSGISKFEADR